MTTAEEDVERVLPFGERFKALTDHPPYPWQESFYSLLLSGRIPQNVNLPTGSGKTSIMAIWLLALAEQAAAGLERVTLPRRLVWVVNRRVVVDQATDEAEGIRGRLTADEGVFPTEWIREGLSKLSGNRSDVLAISTLRGEREDNREWSGDPSRPAIIIGTVDMVGSRLLFSGYGDGSYWRAQHAALLGHDVLIVNDEAHLTPAFAALLNNLEAMQKSGLKSFRTIRLSATHAASECWPESLHQDRLDPSFRKSFESSKGLKIHVHPPGRFETELLELATQPEAGRVLVFVREPERAKRIADALMKKTGKDDRILTLTGTMRGLERDHMVGTEIFKTFAKAATPVGSWWLVATSAGEVGVNISSDRLITDLDTLDHLLQRFGRLNRFGETNGIAHLLVNESEQKPDDKDDRKKRKRAALEFLQGLPPLEDGLLDISPVVLFGLDLPALALSEPPVQAPLHEWHVDVSSQTSLGRHPALPSVEAWLYGKVDDLPETYIAWRNDVNDLFSANEPQDREQALQKYRVLAHEKVTEPTSQLIQKFKALLVFDHRDTRLLRQKRDGSVDVLDLRRLFRQIDTPVGFRNAVSELAYCQLVLPPGYGTLESGMFSPQWTQVGSTENVTEGQDENPDEIDVSGFQIARQGAQIKYVERGASFKSTRLEDGRWSLRRLAQVPGQQHTVEFLADLRLGDLRKFAMDNGWRFLVKVPLEAAEGGPDSQPATLLYFANAGARKPLPTLYPLDEHLCDVERISKSLAAQLGLPEQLVSATGLAGKLHDLGKGEMIWQRAAGNIDNGRGPIAKSLGPMRARDLNGFRHELASLLHADPLLKQLDLQPELRELVLQLIGAHHGRSRPCFKVSAYDRKHFKKSEEFALGTSRRFGTLQDRYGPWGLAYLESILRAADGLASGDREDPNCA